MPARCASTARPTRRANPADAEPRRHRLHPPGAQPLHQPHDRREHLHRRLSAPALRAVSLIDRAAIARAHERAPRRGRPRSRRRIRRSSACRRANASWSRSPRRCSSMPRIIIFDEPTTSLTARETERLFALIERLRAGRQVDDLHLAHPRRRHARSPTTSRCFATASWSRAGPKRELRRRAA